MTSPRILVAALVVFALCFPVLSPQPSLAEGGRAKEVWDRSRNLRQDYSGHSGTDIEIAAGVNITFIPPGYEGGEGAWRLFFTARGGFEVCGTADNASSFYSDGTLWFFYGASPACITVEGNGLSGQLNVRNCTFTNVIVALNNTAGQLENCTFLNCGVYAQNSRCRFYNCSFLTSSLTVTSVNTTNETELVRCRFDGAALMEEVISWRSLPLTGASVYGYASILECEFTRYYYGMVSWAGFPRISDCRAYDCRFGMGIYTEDPVDVPTISNCTAEDCNYTGISVAGNIELRNCTMAGSVTGLELLGMWGNLRPSWTLSGSRIYGNSGYGIVALGAEVDVGDTRFDDGAGTANGLGRLQKLTEIVHRVIAPNGEGVDNYWLNLTDARGGLKSSMVPSSASAPLDLPEYVIENSGSRTEYFPYTMRVEKNNRTNQTTIAKDNVNITLVLSVLADLSPVGVTSLPTKPSGGQYVVFTVTVNNTGAMTTTQFGRRPKALFMVDGERLDEAELFDIAPGSNSEVRALDWKARPGHHTLTVTLDPDNILEENNEADNNLTYEFDVAPAPPAPVVIPYTYIFTALVVILLVAGLALWWRGAGRKAAALRAAEEDEAETARSKEENETAGSKEEKAAAGQREGGSKNDPEEEAGGKKPAAAGRKGPPMDE